MHRIAAATRTLALFVLAALVALSLSACGDDAQDTSTGGDGDGGGGGATSVTVEVSDSSLGQILTDGDGTTLYLFTPDDGTSTCTGSCATAWPPLVGEATAGEGADDSLLGTVERDDGSTQVTYGGHPLYTYAADQASGDVTGQGSGGKWFVVDAAGSAVTSEASGDTDTTEAPADDGY